VPTELDASFYDFSIVHRDVKNRLVSQSSANDFITSQRKLSAFNLTLKEIGVQEQACNVGEYYAAVNIITPTNAFEVKNANQELQNVMLELHNRADVSALELGIANDFAASVSRYLNVNSFLPIIPVRLKFNDNSSVLVKYGFMSVQVEFVPKESFDSNCNMIPDKNSEISREYRFKTAEQFFDMELWLRYYHVQWGNDPKDVGEVCSYIKASCIPTENRHTCTWKKVCG